MSNTTRSLDKIFDVEIPLSSTPLITVAPRNNHDIEKVNEIQDLTNDYTDTRTILNRILIKTETALDEMLEIARANEKGCDFESVGALALTMAKISDRVLDVHKKMNEIRKKEDKKDESPKIGIQQQNNVVFSGSPSELLDMIKKNKNV